MKRITVIVLLSLLLCSSLAYAESFWVGGVWNDTTNNFVPNVLNFDWSSSGSGNMQGAWPVGSISTLGQSTTFRYQSYLFALQNKDGDPIAFPGLNSSFEYTVLAQVPQFVTRVDLGFGVSQLLFLTSNGGVFYIYHDAPKNATVLSGFGFDDGILVASGTVDPNQFSTILYNSNTGLGIGSTILLGKVNYINAAYISPSDMIVGIRLEGTMNYPPLDSTTNAYFTGRAGEGNLTPYSVTSNDFALKVDTSSKFLQETCSVDLEKLVREYETSDPFVDADQCTDAEVPVIKVPGGAEYQLVVTNTGDSVLTNCTITDEQLGIQYDIEIELGPNEEIIFTGQDIPELLKPDRCEAVGQLPNTASITCDCADIQGKEVTDADDACVRCVTCCIDIEKEVSVEPFPNPDWRDADTCSDSDVPFVFAPHNAMYRLIVKNCGTESLSDVTITDTVLGINEVIDDLAPGAQRILTGTDIAELSFDENECTSASSILNTAQVTATCSDPAQTAVSDQDSACWLCEDVVGGCRMTGGINTVTPEGTVVFEAGPYADLTKKVQIRKNTTSEFKYTVGGQVGAPNAGCVAGPDNQFGEWSHSHHENGVLKFTFHGGTHSAPNDAYIHCIACSDPYWCALARCAPFKQLFWEGTGVFKNAKNNDTPIKLSGCTVDTYSKPNDGYTLHYYKAHVGDFGESGNTCPSPFLCNNQPTWDPAVCTWQSGGVEVENTVLMQPQPPVPDSKHPDKFDTGGVACQNCPDWYEIEIYCSSNPPGPGVQPIYRASGWLTGGNLQLHPPVSDQCPFK